MRLESVIEFTKSIVRRVHNARAIVVTIFDQNLRHEFLNFKGWKRRDLRRHEVFRRAFVSNARRRQNKISNFERTVKRAAHSEHEHGLGVDHREQLNDQRGGRRSDRKVDDGNIVTLAMDHAHGGTLGLDATAEFFETITIVIKVRQNDLLTKLRRFATGVACEHVPGDPSFRLVVVDAFGVDEARRSVHEIKSIESF